MLTLRLTPVAPSSSCPDSASPSVSSAAGFSFFLSFALEEGLAFSVFSAADFGFGPGFFFAGFAFSAPESSSSPEGRSGISSKSDLFASSYAILSGSTTSS
jgi:hypothetical protein